MGNDRHRAGYIPFRCDAGTEELVSKLAKEQHRPKSEILRGLVEKGLKTEGYKPEDDRLYDMVKAAMQEVIKPSVERLAAISAKATQISSADFFLLVYIGRLLVPEGDQQLIEEAAARARQLGIEYLKLKDRDMDAFIQSGVEKIIDE